MATVGYDDGYIQRYSSIDGKHISTEGFGDNSVLYTGIKKEIIATSNGVDKAFVLENGTSRRTDIHHRFADKRFGDVHTANPMTTTSCKKLKLLVTTGSYGYVWIWDLVTKRKLAILDDELIINKILSVNLSFSSDCKFLVKTSGNGMVTIWDINTSFIKALRTKVANDNKPKYLAISQIIDHFFKLKFSGKPHNESIKKIINITESNNFFTLGSDGEVIYYENGNPEVKIIKNKSKIISLENVDNNNSIVLGTNKGGVYLLEINE